MQLLLAVPAHPHTPPHAESTVHETAKVGPTRCFHVRVSHDWRTTTDLDDLDAIEARRQHRRVMVSSCLGSIIEFYDFLLYASASALVFGAVFFSTLSPLAGTLASLGTFAAGYVARPVGGVVFGHVGDRFGRKRALMVTLVVMALASVGIGLIPPYERIGLWAPVLLVTLRVVQGVAIGGEWGGATLMAAEHARSRRGLWTSMVNAGAPVGLVLSTLVLSLTAARTTEAQFLEWGWRIAFFGSVVLLVVGVVVRRTVAESPLFRAERGPRDRFPLGMLLRRHPRRLVVGIGVGFGAFALQGTITTFVLAYGAQVGLRRQAILDGLTWASLAAVVGIVGFAALSDRWGRRPVFVTGAVAAAAFAFALLPLVRTGSELALTLALVVGLGVCQAAMQGPLSAMYAELFPTSVRYTGVSVVYQLASLGAGVAPLAFAAVLVVSGTGQTLAISTLLAAATLVSAGCALGLPETSRTDLAAVADQRFPSPIRSVIDEEPR